MSRAIAPIYINGRAIGPGQPTYVIAELSANHGGDYDRAVRLVEAARQAGADAVKLQTYTADTLTLDCDNEHFRIAGTLWDGRTLHDLYGEAFTPWEWQPRLKEVAEGLGLDLFSSPFDPTAVDFLEHMGVPAHKIASFESGDLPLLRRVAATGKPVIMSTGTATLAEVAEAVACLRAAGCQQLALLKCTSVYPAPPGEVNLRTMAHLAEAHGVPVGYSDHTLGVAVATAAVARGACIIEKHIALADGPPTPDSAFSLQPVAFRQMVDAIRAAEAALGSVQQGVSPGEEHMRAFRRSLFIVRDMAAGERFSAENVRSIRPGSGLHPRHQEQVLGRAAARDVSRGTPLSWDLVE